MLIVWEGLFLMCFTANFKAVYTLVLCFINYTATESNRDTVMAYVGLTARAAVAEYPGFTG